MSSRSLKLGSIIENVTDKRVCKTRRLKREIFKNQEDLKQRHALAFDIFLTDFWWQEVGGKNLWRRRTKCLGQYFSNVKIVRVYSCCCNWVCGQIFLCLKRHATGRVIQQNGPIDHVCMADNCDNSHLKRHRVSVKNALNNKELPLFSTNQSSSEC